MVDINSLDDKGYTLLMKAVDDNDSDLVEILLHYNADINKQNDNGETALMLAASDGYVSIVKILLNNDADVNIIDIYSRNAIYKATQRGFLEVIKLLVASNADISLESLEELTKVAYQGKRCYHDKLNNEDNGEKDTYNADGVFDYFQNIKKELFEMTMLFKRAHIEPDEMVEEEEKGSEEEEEEVISCVL